jgi:uncharacterized protein (TIGR03663 family)
MDSAPPTTLPAPSSAGLGLARVRRWSAWPYARIWIVLLAAFLRLYALDLRPPHFDEGVNGWFTDQMQKLGYYSYDPTNYHGPLHFYVLFAFKCLLGRNLWALRLPVVFVSILTVDWIFRFTRFFGRRVCSLAALAMTVSPGFLYYQRDAIHETWLVFFLILLFWGIYGLWQEGEKSYLWGIGMALTGMILTKETYVIHVACLLAAAPCALLLESASPSRRPLFIPEPELPGEGALAPRLTNPDPSLAAITRGMGHQRWTWWDLAAVAATGVALILFFYSGNGFHWQGVKGLVTAFAPWAHKAQVGEGHNKPWWYWFKLIGRDEAWAAFGLLACVRWLGFRDAPDWRLRFLAIYALGTLTAYCIIPYKTPWCIISFIWPFLFIGASAIGEVADITSWRHARRLASGAVGALTAASLFFAIKLNYFRPTSEKEDYVYVQTFPDVNKIVDPLLALARMDPRNYHLPGLILCGSAYPLPWMLGDFTDIGYYGGDSAPPDYHADFILAEPQRALRAEEGMDAPYFRSRVLLRSSLTPLNLYLRASRFAALFPGRKPEFIPHPQAAPPIAPAAPILP